MNVTIHANEICAQKVSWDDRFFASEIIMGYWAIWLYSCMKIKSA